ncbi:unnamed protein product [Citrullus colocynthis]|uniref:Secreted protein n=1 Tax=Citrullus colocynthis TaxID=252529 RepID=A0ABP0Z2C2_9ROSI
MSNVCAMILKITVLPLTILPVNGKTCETDRLELEVSVKAKGGFLQRPRACLPQSSSSSAAFLRHAAWWPPPLLCSNSPLPSPHFLFKIFLLSKGSN